MDKQFYPTPYNICNYLSMLWLTLNHVCKRGPRKACIYHFKISSCRRCLWSSYLKHQFNWDERCSLVQSITHQLPIMYPYINIAWSIVIWYNGKAVWTIVNIYCPKPFVMINIYLPCLNTSVEATLDRQRSGIWMRFAIFITFYQNILYSQIVTGLFKIVLDKLFCFRCLFIDAKW